MASPVEYQDVEEEGEAVPLPTYEGVLHPNGTLTLSPDSLPSHPVRVLVTILETDEDEKLGEVGDYLEQLTDYEERLARGEIRWQ